MRWAGVRFADLLAEAGPRPEAQGAPVRLRRGALRRLAHARRRRSLPDVMLALEMDGEPLSRAARRSRRGRDAADVRLQERQVGQADRGADRQPTTSATGSSAATTRTRGSVARTDSEPRLADWRSAASRRTERALHWVHATGVPRACSRPGSILYLPALSELVAPPQPRQERPSRVGGRLGARDRRRVLVARRPPTAARRLARDRDDRRRRPPLAARAQRAAGPLQRRPEAERAR